MKKRILALILSLSLLLSVSAPGTLAVSHDESGIVSTFQSGTLTCTQQKHTHDETCRSELTCTLTETGGHSHEACETEQKLTCTLEETEEHAHSAEAQCYGESALICTVVENHTHADSCYQAEMELKCGNEAEDHTHDESTCYGPVMEQVCDLAEDETHTHGDGCYTPKTNLICTIHENHTHGDGCYEENIICATPVSEGHRHAEGCYETIYLCGQEEVAAHAHTQDCYALNCEIAEHLHTEDCYTLPETTEAATETTVPETTVPEETTAPETKPSLYAQLLAAESLQAMADLFNENTDEALALTEEEVDSLETRANDLSKTAPDAEAFENVMESITAIREHNGYVNCTCGQEPHTSDCPKFIPGENPATFAGAELWVGGVLVTENNKSDILPDTHPGQVSYDPDTKTLTLNKFVYSDEGYTYSNSGCNAVILSYGIDLNIKVVGTSKLTNTKTEEKQIVAIKIFEGDLKITASVYSDNLTVYGGLGSEVSAGISVDGNFTIDMNEGRLYSHSMTITSGSGDAKRVKEADKNSYGIHVGKDMTIKNGTVEAYGYVGLQQSSGVEIVDGNFLMEGGTAKFYSADSIPVGTTDGFSIVEQAYRAVHAYGLRVLNGTTTIRGGSAEIYAGRRDSRLHSVFGIYSKSAVTIAGNANVTIKHHSNYARPTYVQEFSAGIYTTAPISITTTGKVVVNIRWALQSALSKEDFMAAIYAGYTGTDTPALHVANGELTVNCADAYYKVSHAASLYAKGNIVLENEKKIVISTGDAVKSYDIYAHGDITIKNCSNISIKDYEYNGQSDERRGIAADISISIEKSTISIGVYRPGKNGVFVGLVAENAIAIKDADVTVLMDKGKYSYTGNVIGVTVNSVGGTLTLSGDSKLDVTTCDASNGSSCGVYMPGKTITVNDIAWIKTTAGTATEQSRGVVAGQLVISGGIVEGQAALNGGIGVDFANDPIILPRGYAGCVGTTLDDGVWTLASDANKDGKYSLPRSMFQNKSYGLITAGGLVPRDVHYVDADGTSHWVEYAFSMKYMKEKGVTTMGANVAYTEDTQHRSDFFHGVNWYLVDTDITYDDLLIVNSAINIILGSKEVDGYDVHNPKYNGYYTLTANQGIDVVYGMGTDGVENSLHIWVQDHDEANTGRLVSNGNIGGTENTPQSEFIEINGGIHTVNGGIGSIHGNTPARVTINNAVVSVIGATGDYGIEASTLTVKDSVIFLNNYLATTEVWDNSILYEDAKMTSLDTAVYYGRLKDLDGKVTLNHSHTLDKNEILLVANGQSLTMGKGRITNNGTIYVNYNGVLADASINNVFYQITNGICNEAGETRDVTYSGTLKVIDANTDTEAIQYYGEDLTVGFYYAEDGTPVTVTAPNGAKLEITNTGINVTNGSTEDVQNFTMPAASLRLTGTIYESFDLTITTEGTDNKDPNHSWIFTIVNEEKGINMTVVLVGNASKTIKNLPYGNYTVTEQSGWSWRYEAMGPQKASPENTTLTFTVQRIADQWLDGYAYKKED